MAKIRIDLNGIMSDGQVITFKAPCDCTEVEGIKIYYPQNGELVSETFTMKDSHGFDLTGIGNLFMAGAYVTVVLNTTDNVAHLHNADTNAYIEGRFNSFEETKATIVDSALGKALGMSTSDKWADVVADIEGVVNRGAVSKTFTPSTSSQSYTVSKGYHDGSGKVICSAVTSQTVSSFVENNATFSSKVTASQVASQTVTLTAPSVGCCGIITVCAVDYSNSYTPELSVSSGATVINSTTITDGTYEKVRQTTFVVKTTSKSVVLSTTITAKHNLGTTVTAVWF